MTARRNRNLDVADRRDRRKPIAIAGRIAACVVLTVLLFGPTARAETPLYEEDPYDQITLRDGTVMKVVPLDPAIRRYTDHPKTEGKFEVHPADDPKKAYEIAWRVVARVELFDQLVLAKANELVADGRFDEAYDYFAYLQRNKSGAPTLNASIENALYEEAKHDHNKGQYDGALAPLRELYRRNPKRAGLDRALGRTTDELVQSFVERGDYPSARALLHNLALAFPDHEVVIRWDQRFLSQAESSLSEGRAAVNAKQWEMAAALSRRVTAIRPDLPGARELARDVHRKYARIIVGVSEFSPHEIPGGIDDWAARRDGRLLYRTLTEFMGAGPEGGQYACPVGEIADTLDRRVTIQLKPGIRWAEGNAVLTGSDLSRQLLALADPGSAAYPRNGPICWPPCRSPASTALTWSCVGRTFIPMPCCRSC